MNLQLHAQCNASCFIQRHVIKYFFSWADKKMVQATGRLHSFFPLWEKGFSYTLTNPVLSFLLLTVWPFDLT